MGVVAEDGACRGEVPECYLERGYVGELLEYLDNASNEESSDDAMGILFSDQEIGDGETYLLQHRHNLPMICRPWVIHPQVQPRNTTRHLRTTALILHNLDLDERQIIRIFGRQAQPEEVFCRLDEIGKVSEGGDSSRGMLVEETGWNGLVVEEGEVGGVDV